MTDIGGPLEASAVADDDLGRRRDRTYAYLRLWGIETDLTVLPIVRAPAVSRTSAELRGRAASSALVALKGQGLSQLETFAFADAYAVWDELTVDENDFVLDDVPTREQLVHYAWQFEQTFVFEWALGLVKHLRFPDAAVDTGRVTGLLMEQVLAATDEEPLIVRSAKEIADAADVAFALQAIATAYVHEMAEPGSPVSVAGIVRSVVEERAAAFRWLLSY